MESNEAKFLYKGVPTDSGLWIFIRLNKSSNCIDGHHGEDGHNYQVKQVYILATADKKFHLNSL